MALTDGLRKGRRVAKAEEWKDVRAGMSEDRARPDGDEAGTPASPLKQWVCKAPSRAAAVAGCAIGVIHSGGMTMEG